MIVIFDFPQDVIVKDTTIMIGLVLVRTCAAIPCLAPIPGARIGALIISAARRDGHGWQDPCETETKDKSEHFLSLHARFFGQDAGLRAPGLVTVYSASKVGGSRSIPRLAARNHR
jgi:hypothetical protein